MGAHPRARVWTVRYVVELLVALAVFTLLSLADYATLLHVGLDYTAPPEIGWSFAVLCLMGWAMQLLFSMWLGTVVADILARVVAAGRALVGAARFAAHVAAGR